MEDFTHPGLFGSWGVKAAVNSISPQNIQLHFTECEGQPPGIFSHYFMLIFPHLICQRLEPGRVVVTYQAFHKHPGNPLFWIHMVVLKASLIRQWRPFPNVCRHVDNPVPDTKALLSPCIMSDSTHLVGGQRGGEVVAVQVSACVDVGEADGLAALHWGPPMAERVARPTDTPVAVTVFYSSDPRYRLLSTTCLTHTHTHSEQSSNAVMLKRTDPAESDQGFFCRAVHLINE